MNNNINGGDSTTQNAYRRGIEAAKTKMAGGASKLGNAASTALTSSGHPILGKGAKMLSDQAAKHVATSQGEEQSQEGGVGNEVASKAIEKGASTAAKAAGVPAPLANALGKGASNMVNPEKLEKLEKIRKVMKFFKWISPFAGQIAILFLAVILICVAVAFADEALSGAFAIGEGVVNFISMDGPNSDPTVIRKKIDQAAGECSDCWFVHSNANNNKGLDKNILYATVDHGVVIGPDVYNDEEIKGDDNAGEDEVVGSMMILDKYNSHAFYNMKKEMLGSSGEPGTMIYSLMGEEISVTCVKQSEYDRVANAKAYAKYAYNGLLTSVDIAVTSAKNGLGSIGRLIDTIGDTLAYSSQDADWLDQKVGEIQVALDDNAISAVKEDMAKLEQDKAGCSMQYEYNADGSVATDSKGNPKTLVGQYEAVKINDYKQYYNYIAKVYTPTVYGDYWDNLDRDARIRLAKDTFAEIVAARNDKSALDGGTDVLIYYFDMEGNIITSISGNMSTGGRYVSSTPLGTSGTNWHQNNSPWSSYHLGAAGCTYTNSRGQTVECTMGTIGCYITSIATLIANSGTEITTDTFDPGVFADIMQNNGGITAGGGFGSLSKIHLVAPNFDFVTSVATAGLAPQQIYDFVGQGLHVMIHVDGHHWVAVVGIENGRILISDPWDYGQTGAVYLDSWKYRNVDRVGAFRANDVN